MIRLSYTFTICIMSCFYPCSSYSGTDLQYIYYSYRRKCLYKSLLVLVSCADLATKKNDRLCPPCPMTTWTQLWILFLLCRQTRLNLSTLSRDRLDTYTGWENMDTFLFMFQVLHRPFQCCPNMARTQISIVRLKERTVSRRTGMKNVLKVQRLLSFQL